MIVGIVDYGLGNLRSVAGAVERLNHTPVVTNRVGDLEQADRLILPGVGAFGDGMANLSRLGLIEPLTRLVLTERKLILGICLGAQLMARESEEFGLHEGLGWVDARVVRIAPHDQALRIPHVGWNAVRQVRDDPLFRDVPADALFYFVHSYHICCADPALVVGDCEYGEVLTAAIHGGNLFGTQFHPEKSQLHGLAVLRNFLEQPAEC